jgi:DNA-binding SARP family transcriptional activator
MKASWYAVRLYNNEVPPIRVELLGKLRFSFGQRPLTSVNTNRLQSLLAFLVLHGDAAHSREHLAFLMWPESGGPQARTNLRQLLHHLRRALPIECSLLVTDNQTVRWRRDSACSIDVIDFETAVARAADAEKNGDFTTAREALEEAARLYQDDLLPDLYDEWLQPKREQLRQQLAGVLSRLATLLEMAGDYPAAIRHTTRLIAVDPLREPSYQALMRLHATNHDRSSALRVYHQCMRPQRELGSACARRRRSVPHILKSEHLPALVTSLRAATTPYRWWADSGIRAACCWRRVTQGEMQPDPRRAGIGKSRLAEGCFSTVHIARRAGRARSLLRRHRAASPMGRWPVAANRADAARASAVAQAAAR